MLRCVAAALALEAFFAVGFPRGTNYDWPIRLPLLIYLFCTVFTALWLACRGVGFLWRRLKAH